MNTRQLAAELREEAARCTAAADALEPTSVKHGRRGRKLSAAAKRSISEMMKKRWAERKRATKKPAVSISRGKAA